MCGNLLLLIILLIILYPVRVWIFPRYFSSPACCSVTAYHWKVRLLLLDSPRFDVYAHWCPETSPGWTVPPLSVFPRMTDAPVLLSSLWPFARISPVNPCLSFTGVGTALQMYLTTAEQSRKVTFLALLAMLFSYAALCVASPLATKVHWWLMINYLSTRNSKSFSVL